MPNGDAAVGHELLDPIVAFYDARSCASESEMLDLVAASDPLFVIPVDYAPFRQGRWQEIGIRAPTDEERYGPTYFVKQDAISGALSRYWTDPQTTTSHEVPITLDEAATLEPAAVWSAEHVEERLTDVFLGRRNKWVDLMAPVDPKAFRARRARRPADD